MAEFDYAELMKAMGSIQKIIDVLKQKGKDELKIEEYKKELKEKMELLAGLVKGANVELKEKEELSQMINFLQLMINRNIDMENKKGIDWNKIGNVVKIIIFDILPVILLSIKKKD